MARPQEDDIPTETSAPRLTEKFQGALTYAAVKHHRSLLDVYQHKTDSWLVDELRRTLDALEELINAA